MTGDFSRTFERRLTLIFNRSNAQVGLKELCQLWGTSYESDDEYKTVPWKGMLGINRASSPQYIDGAEPFICGDDKLFKPLMKFVPENKSRVIRVSGQKFIVTHVFKTRPKIEKEEAIGYEHLLIAKAPPFKRFSFKVVRGKYHEVGNARCNAGGCGLDDIFDPYPRLCECGGLIHRSHYPDLYDVFPDEKCDKCGKESEEESEESEESE